MKTMKTMKFFLLMAVPVILLSCGNQGGEQDKNNNNNDRNKSNTTRDTVSRGSFMVNLNLFNQSEDEDFLKEAASGGMMEVELGTFAQQNATNQRVKSFGEMMVRDHSKANDELKSLAQGKNITLPSMMTDKHRNKLEDLQKEQGSDFDKAYIKLMVDDHQDDVDKFRKQAEDGKDPEIKAFASKTLPVLEMHLDSAKSIRDGLK